MPNSAAPSSELMPFPALIGDIGGTNARFALIADPHAEAKYFPTARVADFPSIDAAIQATVLDHTALQPRSATLALAAPIHGDEIPMTNSSWVVAPKRLIAGMGLHEVVLLNDFEALALALPTLEPEDYAPLGGGRMVPNGPKVVVGPGTGLGAAGLLNVRNTWIPSPGEGGHITMAPLDAEDARIWPHLEKMGGGERVSAEWVLSGRGLLHLYRAVCDAAGEEPRFTHPAEVSHAGMDHSDARAHEALDRFAVCLGRYAGDLALIYLATGGVYLAGGISRFLAPFLAKSGFRAAFTDKWPHSALMETMATVAITHPVPALSGIAAFVRTPGRFGLTLAGRHWRG